jgi:hypothetical protein
MTAVVERAWTPRHVAALRLAVAEITTSPELSEVFRRNGVDRGRRSLAARLRSVFAAHGVATGADFDQWSDILFGAAVATPILHALVGDWTSHDRASIDHRIRSLTEPIASLHRAGSEAAGDPAGSDRR